VQLRLPLHADDDAHVEADFTDDDGVRWIERPYTPIDTRVGAARFVVRQYAAPHGRTSRRLCALPLGSALVLHGPRGRFKGLLGARGGGGGGAGGCGWVLVVA
jgi:streptogramin lyase